MKNVNHTWNLKPQRNLVKTIERELELLSLFHGDLKDLNNTMTRGGKRFYITFLGEAKDDFIKYKNEVENQLRK